jgi:hypothetical protein
MSAMENEFDGGKNRLGKTLGELADPADDLSEPADEQPGVVLGLAADQAFAMVSIGRISLAAPQKSTLEIYEAYLEEGRSLTGFRKMETEMSQKYPCSLGFE